MRIKLLLATLLFTAIAFAGPGLAHGEEVHVFGFDFPAETYELFVEWARDAGAVTDENRQALKPLFDLMLAAHVETGLDGTKRITFQLPYTSKASESVKYVKASFREHLIRQREGAFEARRRKHDDQIDMCHAQLRDLHGQMRGLEREIFSAGGGANLEGVREEFRGLEAASFDVKMQLAEGEAKRRVILRKLEELELALGPRQKAMQEQRMLIQREMGLMEKEMAAVKKRSELEHVGVSDVWEAEAKVVRLQREAARFESEAARESSPLTERLREHLIDLEIEAAGAEARRDVMSKRQAELDAILNRLTKIEETRWHMGAKMEDREQKIQELTEWPVSPEDMPLDVPTLVYTVRRISEQDKPQEEPAHGEDGAREQGRR